MFCHDKQGWGWGENCHKVCKLRYKQGYEKHMNLPKSRGISIGYLRPYFQLPKMWETVPRLIITQFYGPHAYAKEGTFFFPWQLPAVVLPLDMSTRLYIVKFK